MSTATNVFETKQEPINIEQNPPIDVPCCDRCGDDLAAGYEERHWGYDFETGYTDIEIVCARCLGKLCDICKASEWDCRLWDDEKGEVKYCYDCAPRQDVLSTSKFHTEDL